MDILVKAGQLILSLSILVVLHELGHFVPARLFKTRVEKFYLFFNPWFSLFKIKRGDTEYGVGWLPLGGYVKIAGMVDESMDKNQMKQAPQPWEFRSKPAWQRLIIMLGGVTVNLILGYIIFIFILWTWGREYLPVENAKYGIAVNHEVLKPGELLHNGDHILTVGGVKPQTLEQANRLIVIDGHRDMEVLRDGATVKVTLPSDIEQQMLHKDARNLFDTRIPFVVSRVAGGGGAEKGGLLPNDSIVGINEVQGVFFQDVGPILAQHKSQTVAMHVVREGKPLTLQIEIDNDGKMGANPVGEYSRFFETRKETFGFWESIPAGIAEGNDKLTGYVKSLALVFTPAGAKQIGGFGSIGGLFSSSWNWEIFWNMTAFLSIILAFMNLLPIPALDGGHVMFLIYEMISGKAPGERFMEIAQVTGMVLLLGLMLFANGNDIVKLFR